MPSIYEFIRSILGGEPKQKQILVEYMIKLFSMYSPTGSERGVSEFCSKELSRFGFVSLTDHVGNVLASRGDSPTGKYLCLNAHTDTVQRKPDAEIEVPGAIKYDTDLGVIHTGNKFIMGADDKAGVAVILTIAMTTSLPMKVLLTVGEEYGAVGINALNKGFFNDVFACITLDRKGGSDIIQEYCGLTCAPDGFVDVIKRHGLNASQVEYTVEHGSFADTYIIANYVPCINMSVGYYNPHGNTEHVYVDQTYNTLKTCVACLKHVDELYNAVVSAPEGWQKRSHAGFGSYKYKGLGYTKPKTSVWKKGRTEYEYRSIWDLDELEPTRCTKDACLFDYASDKRLSKRKEDIAKACKIRHVNEDDDFRVKTPRFASSLDILGDTFTDFDEEEEWDAGDLEDYDAFFWERELADIIQSESEGVIILGEVLEAFSRGEVIWPVEYTFGTETSRGNADIDNVLKILVVDGFLDEDDYDEAKHMHRDAIENKREKRARWESYEPLPSEREIDVFKSENSVIERIERSVETGKYREKYKSFLDGVLNAFTSGKDKFQDQDVVYIISELYADGYITDTVYKYLQNLRDGDRKGDLEIAVEAKKTEIKKKKKKTKKKSKKKEKSTGGVVRRSPEMAEIEIAFQNDELSSDDLLDLVESGRMSLRLYEEMLEGKANLQRKYRSSKSSDKFKDFKVEEILDRFIDDDITERELYDAFSGGYISWDDYNNAISLKYYGIPKDKWNDTIN